MTPAVMPGLQGLPFSRFVFVLAIIASLLDQAIHSAKRGFHRRLQWRMRLIAKKTHQLGIVQLNGRSPERARRMKFAHRLVEGRCQPEEPPRHRPHWNVSTSRTSTDRRDDLRSIFIPMAAEVKTFEIRKLCLAVHQLSKCFSSVRQVAPCMANPLGSRI